MFVQAIVFKRKFTYISDKGVSTLATAHLYAKRGEHFGWANFMFYLLFRDV